MKTDLVKAGIPKQHIYLNFAGFRTMNTIVRAKKVFSLDEFTIISQKFHNERSICLVKWQNISATGFMPEMSLQELDLKFICESVYHE